MITKVGGEREGEVDESVRNSIPHMLPETLTLWFALNLYSRSKYIYCKFEFSLIKCIFKDWFVSSTR